MAKYSQEWLSQSLHSYRDNLEEIINLIEEEKWQYSSGILEANEDARPELLN